MKIKLRLFILLKYYVKDNATEFSQLYENKSFLEMHIFYNLKNSDSDDDNIIFYSFLLCYIPYQQISVCILYNQLL